MTRPVPLAEAGDPGEFGGKTASLSRAIRLGLPVPPGLGLSVAYVEAVARGEAWSVAGLHGTVEALGGSVAVRSSAVGEDERDTSFAGQHLTLLNVSTEDALISGICEVHRSAHSASALAYREQMGIAGEPRIGVALQRLVRAEAAGVLFTRNPVTGARERLIEAAWGLGEAVVSGLVLPDSYRITPAGEIVERTAGEKEVRLQPSPAGKTAEVPVDPERIRALTLDDGQLLALHRLTLRCEAEYGDCLDIEWAFAGGELYLLQCRAITR